MAKSTNKKQSKRLRVENSIHRKRRIRTKNNQCLEETFDYELSSISRTECALMLGRNSI